MTTHLSKGAAIAPQLPLLTRLSYAIRIWAAKIFVSTILRLIRIIQSSKYRALAATYTKRYPVRPTLESRIFLPRTYKSGTLLPLYINIHGGGFTVCDPATDDHFCRYFSDEFEYCVVSLDYRKAPTYPFPIPVHDCAELARAVLADSSLPVDHNRIALGGFSAGGNLSLAIAQFPDIGSKLQGIVPIYPVTDFTQRYRGEYMTTPDGKQDVLKHTAKLFNWAYVPAGLDRTDPLLSCVYATRKSLPQKMYFVGAECDCLCNEAHTMAESLAGVEGKDTKSVWSANGIKWEMMALQQHGFTHIELKGDEEKERTRVCHDLYKRIDIWLREEAFSQ